MQSSEPVIRTEHLTVDFPGVRAVDGVNLEIQEGEIFGLVGPDGAGKTTMIRVLATILQPSAGRAFVWGHDVFAEPRSVRGTIGYMSQRFNLYGDLSVVENLRFFAELYRIPRHVQVERMEQLIHFARLEAFRNRRAEFLSGGMKQKLALACTLIHEPRLLLLDEPTTGVDPVSRREFWAILSELHRRGVTLLISTPYMDESERCSRVAFMTGGRIAVVGRPAAMKSEFGAETVELVAKPAAAARRVAERLPYVLEVETYGERLRLTVASARDAMSRLEDDLRGTAKVLSLKSGAVSMETIFVKLSKSTQNGDAT